MSELNDAGKLELLEYWVDMSISNWKDSTDFEYGRGCLEAFEEMKAIIEKAKEK